MQRDNRNVYAWLKRATNDWNEPNSCTPFAFRCSHIHTRAQIQWDSLFCYVHALSLSRLHVKKKKLMRSKKDRNENYMRTFCCVQQMHFSWQQRDLINSIQSNYIDCHFLIPANLFSLVNFPNLHLLGIRCATLRYWRLLKFVPCVEATLLFHWSRANKLG